MTSHDSGATRVTTGRHSAPIVVRQRGGSVVHLEEACCALQVWDRSAGSRLAAMRGQLCAVVACRRCRRWAWSLGGAPGPVQVAVALASARVDARLAGHAALLRIAEARIGRVHCPLTEQLLLAAADRAIAAVLERWDPSLGAAPGALLEGLLVWRRIDAGRGAAVRREAERVWFADRPVPPSAIDEMEGDLEVAAVAAAAASLCGEHHGVLVRLAVAGVADATAARAFGTDRATVGRWRRRLGDLAAVRALA